MAYRALSTVSLGNSPSAHAGDLIPDTFLDVNGEPQPVDFDRLLELGVAQDDAAPVPEAPAVPDPATLNRDDLNAHAATVGVEAPEALPNKQAVLEAVAAAATPVPEPGPAPEA